MSSWSTVNKNVLVIATDGNGQTFKIKTLSKQENKAQPYIAYKIHLKYIQVESKK